MLHALATLDLGDEKVVGLVVEELLANKPEELHAEEVAIVAW